MRIGTRRVALTLLLLTIVGLSTGTAAGQATRPVLLPGVGVPQPWVPGFGGTAAEHGIAIILPPGIAPCVLHVNALRVPLPVGTPLTTRYEWDFGDPGSRWDWVVGFTAAHVYDRAGEYHVTLTVTDEAGTKRVLTTTIVIEADRRHRIFVAPEGSDGNAGTSPDLALKTAAAAFKKLVNGTEIQFKAGGTYEVDDTLKIPKSDVVVGRYGDGPDPVIEMLHGTGQNKGSGQISMDNGCNGVMIEHLTFATPYAPEASGAAPKVGIDVVKARGRNITVRNCTFHNVDNAINSNGGPTGLLVQDCSAPGPTDIRAYLVWGQGTDHVYLGNVVANSTREHCVRLSGVQRVLIAGNDFTNLDRRPGDPGDYTKGTIEMHAGAYAYIVWNKATDGTIRVGPLGLHEPDSVTTEWAVVDSNELVDTYVPVYSGSHHVMIRNNLIRSDDKHAFQIMAPSENNLRFTADVTIANNTVIDNGRHGSFLLVGGAVDGIRVVDNLFVAPHLEPGSNGASVIADVDEDWSSFAEVSHNVWPVTAGPHIPGAFAVGPGKGPTRWVDAAGWAKVPRVAGDTFANVTVDAAGCPAGGPAVGGGVGVPGVLFDRDGHPRPTAHPTIGAAEPVAAK